MEVNDLLMPRYVAVAQQYEAMFGERPPSEMLPADFLAAIELLEEAVRRKDSGIIDRQYPDGADV